ncbi:hypothetical protein IC766_15690 [Acinetobacter seifertii]|uniref:hypothetical protein n=1 Tax=Acinetobacter seifertii TaxID=1530123 RepID=UPI00168A6B13|nr:hypothetical protein [Acinetobacter seifertii]QNY13512.1 hypothetical protein IC766_15690 [Acinetobacter seifertii]
MEKKYIQKYVNNFRRQISHSFKPGIGLRAYIYPTLKDGAVIVFQFGNNLENDDVYKKTFDSIPEILKKINQNIFGGDISNLTFSGTNTIMENDRVIFIKDESIEEWSEEATKNDISKIFNASRQK